MTSNFSMFDATRDAFEAVMEIGSTRSNFEIPKIAEKTSSTTLKAHHNRYTKLTTGKTGKLSSFTTSKRIKKEKIHREGPVYSFGFGLENEMHPRQQKQQKQQIETDILKETCNKVIANHVYASKSFTNGTNLLWQDNFHVRKAKDTNELYLEFQPSLRELTKNCISAVMANRQSVISIPIGNENLEVRHSKKKTKRSKSGVRFSGVRGVCGVSGLRERLSQALTLALQSKSSRSGSKCSKYDILVDTIEKTMLELSTTLISLILDNLSKRQSSSTSASNSNYTPGESKNKHVLNWESVYGSLVTMKGKNIMTSTGANDDDDVETDNGDGSNKNDESYTMPVVQSNINGKLLKTVKTRLMIEYAKKKTYMDEDR